jgi:hypothetical protein
MSEPQLTEAVSTVFDKFKTISGGFFNQLLDNGLYKTSNITIQELRDKSFKEITTDILKDGGKTLTQYQSSIKGYLQKIGGPVVKLAIGEALGFLELGPAGVVAGEALGQLIETWAGKFLTDPQSMQNEAGEWCIIDLNEKVKENKETYAAEAWGEIMEFDDFDSPMTHQDMKRESYSVGFYVEGTMNPEEIIVYEFTAQKTLTVKRANCRFLSEDEAGNLDNSKELSFLREVYMIKHFEPKLLDEPKEVFQQGSEVFKVDKDGKTRQYHVVNSSGNDVLIEDLDGNRLQTTRGALDLGRRNQDAVSQAMTGDFIFLEKKNDDIFKTCEVSLCCVAYFDGDDVIAYECYNGIKRVENSLECQLISPNYRTLLSSLSEFIRFKTATINCRSDIKDFKLPDKYLNVCFGTLPNLPQVKYTVEKELLLIADRLEQISDEKPEQDRQNLFQNPQFIERGYDSSQGQLIAGWDNAPLLLIVGFGCFIGLSFLNDN